MNITNSSSFKTLLNDNIYETQAIDLNSSLKAKPKQPKTKKRKIVIDSRDRNIIAYPSQSKYVIKMNETINDVVSIELSDYYISLTRPLINSTNNNLSYTVDNGSTTKNVTLPNGNYSGDALAAQLKIKLGADTGEIKYNADTQKLIFNTNNNDFKFLFANDKSNLNNVLGFDKNQYDTANNKIESSFILNLQNDNYILMVLENANTIISNNPITNKSFAIIKDNTYTQEIITRTFNPPLNFSTFNISFFDYYGNLYDFENHEHRLEFIIETINKSDNIY